MILDLQDAKIGDVKRLEYILDRIKNDRPIYNSDEQYMRENFIRLRWELEHKSDNNPEQPSISDTKDLPHQKSKNNGATKVALVTSLFFLIIIPIFSIMHGISPGRYVTHGPDPSRIEPIKSECFLAQGVTKWV